LAADYSERFSSLRSLFTSCAGLEFVILGPDNPAYLLVAAFHMLDRFDCALKNSRHERGGGIFSGAGRDFNLEILRLEDHFAH
jgi:hypothetical protein